MKKFFAIIISAVMALSVWACGGGDKPEETTNSYIGEIRKWLNK